MINRKLVEQLRSVLLLQINQISEDNPEVGAELQHIMEEWTDFPECSEIMNLRIEECVNRYYRKMEEEMKNLVDSIKPNYVKEEL